jgi:hypothetical protein
MYKKGGWKDIFKPTTGDKSLQNVGYNNNCVVSELHHSQKLDYQMHNFSTFHLNFS